MICKTHNSFTTDVNDLYEQRIPYISFQVKRAVQQTGYLRVKRGFKPKITGVPVSEIKLKLQSLDEDKARAVNVKIDGKSPTDPLFKKEWYLVSITMSRHHCDSYVTNAWENPRKIVVKLKLSVNY